MAGKDFWYLRSGRCVEVGGEYTVDSPHLPHQIEVEGAPLLAQVMLQLGHQVSTASSSPPQHSTAGYQVILPL